MRVLIAPDSFKGSLDAAQAAKCMARGVGAVFPEAECDLAPVADGGEGTVRTLVMATGGRELEESVLDPLGREIRARWGLLGDGRTAVVEMAAASGLPLLSARERDPLRADTYGTGQLLRAALRALHESHSKTQSKTLIVGIGGSATNDGGSGCLRALGARFLDAAGHELPPGGAALARLARIDLDGLEPLLAQTHILVACDVDNPLTGPRGASAVFGPQKGAGPGEVRLLDDALSHFARIAGQASGLDMATRPGAGAAGGLGAGLLYFTGARLKPGVELVLEAVNFQERAALAQLVLTGEGRSDAQTASGKAPAGVAGAAKAAGRPVVCISGSLGPGAEALYDRGVDVLAACVSEVKPLEEYLDEAGLRLTAATERVLRGLRLGMKLADS